MTRLFGVAHMRQTLPFDFGRASAFIRMGFRERILDARYDIVEAGMLIFLCLPSELFPREPGSSTAVTIMSHQLRYC